MVSGVTSDPLYRRLGHQLSYIAPWARPHIIRRHLLPYKGRVNTTSISTISPSAFVLNRSPFRPHYSAYRCELRPSGAMNTDLVPSLSGVPMDLAD